MKKRVISILLIFILMLTFCGCNTDRIYTTPMGIAVNTDRSWKEITEDEDLAYIYGEVDDVLKESLELVLEGKNAYLTIEKYDISEELEGHEEYLLWLQGKYQTLGADEMTGWLSTEGIQDSLLLTYEKIGMKTELTQEDIHKIAILTANKTWHMELAAHMEDYELLQEEEVVFLGEYAILSEYVYAGAQGKLLQFYEANCIKDGYFYTLTIFTDRDQFDKNKETYRNIIMNCQMTEAES